MDIGDRFVVILARSDSHCFQQRATHSNIEQLRELVEAEGSSGMHRLDLYSRDFSEQR